MAADPAADPAPRAAPGAAPALPDAGLPQVPPVPGRGNAGPAGTAQAATAQAATAQAATAQAATAQAATAQAARDWLLELQDMARVGIWQYDLPQGAVRWSPGMLRIHAVAEAPTDLDGVEAFVEPDDRPRVRRIVEEAISGMQPREFDYRIRRPDGTQRTVRARLRVESADGEAKRLLGTVQDVTEETELARTRDEARRLRELNDYRTRFVNVAAHELKTPLTPIRIHVELLGREMVDAPEPQRRSLQALERAVERLNALVDDFLDAARLQATELRVRRQPVRLDGLAAEAVAAYAPVAESFGVELRSELAPDITVEGDATRLLQLVNNLVSNALKFTPRGGHVAVHLDAHGNEAELCVQDSGPGFDAHQAAELFRPFSQVHDPANRATGGTGLGLYIAKGIAEAHGGSLEARSAGPGRGAAFTLRLPLLKVVAPLRPARPKRTALEDRLRNLI